MSMRQAFLPKKPRNFQIMAGACLFLLLVYLVAAWGGWPWSPKRGIGLAAGFLAAFLFFFEMLYPFRRPRARPLRSAQNWVQAHVYLGMVAPLAVFIHTGFSLPHGWMGWMLLGLALWATFTGILGVFLQKWLPSTLSEGLRVEALYDRIPALVDGLRREADELMDGASDALENFYRTQVREPLSQLAPSLGYVFDVRGGRERALEPFRRMSQFVDPEEKEKIDDLMVIYSEKLELDAQYSLQGLLRRWLTWTLHVPAAGLLLGLMLIHVLTWVIY